MTTFLFLFATAVAASFFGFAGPVLHAPAAALLLPAALTAAARLAPSSGAAFKRGLLMGGAAAACSLYWVAVPVHDYGFLPWALAVPCPILLGLYIGLYAGIFCLVMRKLHRPDRPVLTGLAAGLVWGGLELLRGFAFTGFPWLSLASAFAALPVAIQALDVVGVYGLGGVHAAVGALMFVGRPQAKTLIAAGTVLAVVLGYGVWRLQEKPADGPAITVAMAQGNIDQSLKWDESFQDDVILRYVRLSREAADNADIDLLVWPETALPFYFQRPHLLGGVVRSLTKELQTPLLTGAPAYGHGAEEDETVFYNRAYLLNEQGDTVDYYDKQHLVPFGEYVPMQRILFFLDKLVQGVGDFKSGQSAAPLTGVSIDGNELQAGMLICYEGIFPELAQSTVREGAEALVNISNDAWFGRTSAPAQHLHLSILRAVEQRRPLIRCTNTGVSALVDAHGRIMQQSGLYETVFLIEDIVPSRSTSFFHEWYVVIHSILACSAALCVVVAFIVGRSKKTA